jgi:hypothetical protein
MMPPVLALGKPEPVQWVKYLNPIPQKGYSLNKDQDRIIKKKGFKTLEIAGAKPIFNDEVGIYAIINYKDLGNSQLINDTLDKAVVNGISVSIPWKDLEPQDDQFDWSKIESILNLAQAKKKFVILRVSSCGVDTSANSDTPEWVFEAGTKALTFKDSEGKEHKMPIFWDSTYLPQWDYFITELGKKFDGNKTLHSVGMTGGGIQGRTLVVPELSQPLNKILYKELKKTLTKEHGMSQRQLVEHWKYVADIFPRTFKTTRLNFDIDPPTPNRAGQDSLDEISDYIIYRYGQRVYLTRMSIDDSKHGFDQYRVLLKFHNDTFTGYQLSDTLKSEDLGKLAQFAKDDGISFVEIPVAILNKDDEAIKTAITKLQKNLGYQIVAQKITLPESVKAGDSFKANFIFANLGSASALKPQRELDKDLAASYKIQLELQDENSKPRALLLHTPTIPTQKWTSNNVISWEGEIKTPAKLKPGKYKVLLSLIDTERKRKLVFLNGLDQYLETSMKAEKKSGKKKESLAETKENKAETKPEVKAELTSQNSIEAGTLLVQ